MVRRRPCDTARDTRRRATQSERGLDGWTGHTPTHHRSIKLSAGAGTSARVSSVVADSSTVYCTCPATSGPTGTLVSHTAAKVGGSSAPASSLWCWLRRVATSSKEGASGAPTPAVLPSPTSCMSSWADQATSTPAALMAASARSDLGRRARVGVCARLCAADHRAHPWPWQGGGAGVSSGSSSVTSVPSVTAVTSSVDAAGVAMGSSPSSPSSASSPPLLPCCFSAWP